MAAPNDEKPAEKPAEEPKPEVKEEVTTTIPDAASTVKAEEKPENKAEEAAQPVVAEEPQPAPPVAAVKPKIEDETSTKAEAESPPDEIANNESGEDSKLLKELDDEAPKTFPQVLMEILSNDENADTISWLPHGRGFIIYKKKKFASHVLPKYFKATKFTSFTRKLNRWGFTRVTRGPEMGSYYHKLFLREDPSLCLRMSSHSSTKFQEQQQMIPPPMPGGMPFGGFPFPMGGMGMPGMPGMPGGMPGNPMAGGMNPADLSQQSHMINQQLQHLQWQQFQLQHLQQQQFRNAEMFAGQQGMAQANAQQQQQQQTQGNSGGGNNNQNDGNSPNGGNNTAQGNQQRMANAGGNKGPGNQMPAMFQGGPGYPQQPMYQGNQQPSSG